MKQLTKFIQEKLKINSKSKISKNYQGDLVVIEDKDYNVISLIDEEHVKKIFKLLYDHKFDKKDIVNDEYILANITSHYENYKYDEDEKKLIDYAVNNNATIYKAMEVILDIGEYLGLVIVKKK